MEDVELATRALRLGGFRPEVHQVDSAAGLSQALARGGWDLVIADYQMPSFTGIEALKMVRAARLEVPFILVSGTIGEETAVEAMRAGAHDYLLKGHLARLPVAVERELREAELRRERSRSERAALFLNQVSAALAESLDYEETLNRVAELAVPELCDWCIVDLLDSNGVLQRVATAHADPAQRQAAIEFARRYPALPGAELGPSAVVQTGRPVVVSDISEVSPELLGEPERVEMLRALRVVSYLTVPLTGRGAVHGTLTFLSTHPERRYVERDVELALEIGRRAALAIDNARLYARAQEAIRLRDEFLSIASHELKTPLTPLQLQLQSIEGALKAPADQSDPTRLLGKVERAIRSTGRLAALVESLLDVSRIAQGKMRLNLERFDLGEAVKEVVERFSEESARAGSHILLKIEQPLVGRWDRLRVEQVISNLLANAVKYGQGKPIEVAVDADGGDSARIRVDDQGIGISQADLHRIFGRFERAVPMRHYGGLGLGLYIAQQIVQAHGGSIDVTSAPERGSSFTVSLPLTAESSPS